MIVDHMDMEKRFNELVSERIANKGRNNQLFTNEQYVYLLNKIKRLKSNTMRKRPEDYHRLAMYDVYEYGMRDKLIAPIKNDGDPIIYFVSLEETFQIIHDCHIGNGHAGKNRMMPILKTRYKNVTAELVSIYLKLCEFCKHKRVGKRRTAPENDFFKLK